MQEKITEIFAIIDDLKKELPIPMEVFENFWAAAEKESVLDAKTKLLINIALSIAAQCEWCLTFYVRAALNKGATRQEILDAASMAILMHGGSALMEMIPLVKALNEFDKTSNNKQEA